MVFQTAWQSLVGIAALQPASSGFYGRLGRELAKVVELDAFRFGARSGSARCNC